MKKNRLFLLLIFILTLIASITFGINAFKDSIKDKNCEIDSPEAIQKELLEVIDSKKGEYNDRNIILSNTTPSKAKKMAKDLGAEIRLNETGNVAKLQLPIDTDIKEIVSDKTYLSYMNDISLDFYMSLSDIEETEYIPNRPNYDVADSSYINQTYLDYLNIGDTWKTTKGDGVTVAVIDTGIDTDHPEFSGRISEWSYNATLDKVVKNYNLENGSYDWSLIEDENGHGTSVSGILAASMNDGEVIGIAPKVNILVIKCELKNNQISTSDIIFGIYYAIERDVNVINMSLGGNVYNEALEEALSLAYDSDIISVAAAGNDSSASLTYPAASKYVYGVGALAENSWELAEYSNYGENVNLVAPGTTYTTTLNGEYKYISGTSMASPIVAGAIALYLSKNRYTKSYDIDEVLYASCKDLGDLGCDWYYGYGAVDFSALLLEIKGIVTFNMLTDELDDIKKVFIKNHTLQTIPTPERLYSVFDGWYYDIHCTEPYNLYSDKFTTDLTLYAKWVNEDDGVPYSYVELDDGTIEITGYTGKRKYITIPDFIDDKVVSSIGVGAFKDETDLREVTLPMQLVTIKDRAFYGCSNLTSIVIPDTVVTIEDEAFYENIRLSSVMFGENSALTKIGSSAFNGCSKLKTFTIGKNVSSLSESAFLKATSILSFEVDSDNAYYSSNNGLLFDKNEKLLIAYPYGRNGTVILPETTLVIGSNAFQYANITNIENWGSVTNIKDYAFYNSKLEGTLVLPNSLESMGTCAFANNNYITELITNDKLQIIPEKAFEKCSNLTSVYIGKNVSTIIKQAFYQGNLKNVYFSEESTLKIIGDNAFEHNKSLNNIKFPLTLEVIGSYSFSNTAISSIILPDSLKEIKTHAFSETLLEELYIPKNVQSIGGGITAYTFVFNIDVDINNENYVSVDGVVYTKEYDEIVLYPSYKTDSSYKIIDGVSKVGKSAFEGTYFINEVIVPENCEIIGGSAFKKSLSLTTVVLNNGLHTIEQNAFEFCLNLKNINLPEGLKSVKANAFNQTISLTEIVIPNSLTILEVGSFKGSGANSYVFPNTLTEIQEEALSNNTHLTSLTIPDNVIHIGRNAFAGNNMMRAVYFTENSKLPRISYGAFANCGIRSFTIPSNVDSISQGAFNNCTKLTSVKFQANSKLTSIPAYLFEGCSELVEITFEEGSSLTNIQAHGFEGISNLKSINFADAKITNIGNFAFRFCGNLIDVIIPESVTEIGRFAFYGCTKLSKINIPASVEYIGRGAFVGTNEINLYFASEILPKYLDEYWDNEVKGYYLGVNDIVVTEEFEYAILTSGNVAIIKYLGNNNFINLNNFDFGGNIVNIGGEAFANTNVEEIILPNTVINIQSRAFYNSKLKNIVIPSSVEFIGKYAFANTLLEQIIFENNANIKVIEQYAFENTSELKSIQLPKSLTTLGIGVFKNSGLEEVNFEEAINITEISEDAFAYTKLNEVELPNGISLINNNAFRGIINLKKIVFNTDVDIVIMNNVFYETGLLELYIPKNIIYIGKYTFVGLDNLTDFAVDENNKYYSTIDGVLVDHSKRKLIAMPAGKVGNYEVPLSIEEIGFGAFEDSKLSSINFNANANILTFGYRAFYNCDNLTEITIPSSVVSIDYYAFANSSNLKKVTFAENSGLTGIYEGAFFGCGQLTDIELPDSIIEISDFAFYGCNKLTKIPVSKNSRIKGIYSYAMAYSGLRGNFTTPKSLIDIGEYAFMGTKITSITIPNTNAYNLNISIGAFEDCKNVESVTLPFIGNSFEDSKITWFGYIFGAGTYEANNSYVPEGLKEIIINGELTEIGEGAFYDLINVEEIILPETLNVLGANSFYNTQASYTITGPISGSINKVYGIENKLDNTMFGSGFYGDLIIDEGTKSIDLDFEPIPNINNLILSNQIEDVKIKYLSTTDVLYIPDSVITLNLLNCSFNELHIGANLKIFTHKNLKVQKFSVSENNQNFVFVDGILYDNPVTNIVYVSNQISSRVEILDGVKVIKGRDFQDLVVNEIVIPDSVETIEREAFFGLFNLSKLTLGKNVKEIKDKAFVTCYELKEIVNNSSLVIDFDKTENGGIGNYAYKIANANGDTLYKDGYSNFEIIDTADGFRFINDNNRYQLVAYFGSERSIKLPPTINENHYSVKEFIADVEEIIIPNTSITIDQYSFDNCKYLRNIIVEEGSYNYNSYDGVLYDKKFTKIIVAPKNIEQVTILGTVKSIQSYLFTDSIIESVIIEAGLKTIDHNAFSSCYNLKSIIIPNTVTTIKYNAFSDCRSLINVELPDSVTTIERSIFYRCYSLEKIELPSNITTIPDSTFANCRSLTTVILPSELISIGEEAFYGCESLTNLKLDEGLTSIGHNAFNKCFIEQSCSLPKTILEYYEDSFDPSTTILLPKQLHNINGIIYSEDFTKMICVPTNISGDIIIPEGITSIKEGTFKKSKINSIILPETLITIEKEAFKESTIKSIVLPQSLEKIATAAFYGCTNLKDVTLPKNLKTLDSDVFNYCTSLTEITIPGSVQYIPSQVIAYCSNLKSIIFENGVNTLSNQSVIDCENLEYVYLPESITSIQNTSFKNTPKLIIEVSKNSNFLRNVDSVIYTSNKIIYVPSMIEGNITVPEGIISIEKSFANCSNITSITLPDSVTTNVSEQSFLGCTNLSNIYVSDNHSKFSSIDGVLYDKFIKELVAIPAGFTGKLEIPEGVTTLKGDYSWLNTITEIQLPSTLSKIQENMFNSPIEIIYNNSSLPIKIGESSYGNIAKYAKVIIDKDGNKTYGDEIFDFNYSYIDDFIYKEINGEIVLVEYTGNLDVVRLPLTINGRPYSLYEFKGAKHVILPEGFEKVSSYAFYKSDLEQIDLPSTLHTIEDSAFRNSQIKSITIPENVLNMEYGIFINCFNLKTVNILANVETLPDSLFNGCYILEKVTLPKNLKVIGSGCFTKCTQLKEIIIPNSVVTIGNSAFYKCTQLSNIVLGDNITTIDKNAFTDTAYYNDFSNWSKDTLYLNDYLIKVDDNASYFELKNNTSLISLGAYDGCQKLKLVYVEGDSMGILSDVTNIETIVIFNKAPQKLANYFKTSDSDTNYDVPITIKNVVIKKGVTISKNLLLINDIFYLPKQYLSGVKIYVENIEEEVFWDENYPNWNNENRVYYGNKWKFVSFYNDESLLSMNPVLNVQIIKLPWVDDIYDGNYIHYFRGFDIDGDGITDSIAATSSIDINAKIVYEKLHICASGHIGGEATCEKLAVCTRCRENYGEIDINNHLYEKTYVYDDNDHWYPATCAHVDITKDKAPHELIWTLYTEASCTTPQIYKGVCECGYITSKTGDQQLEHEYSENWKYDEIHHWHECSCKEPQELIEHVYGEGVIVSVGNEKVDDIVKFTCVDCAYSFTEAFKHVHKYSDTYITSSVFHWKKCSCGSITPKEAHNFEFDHISVEPTETQIGEAIFKCTICDFKNIRYIEFGHSHNYDSEWCFDDINHWKECSCYITTEKEIHDLQLYEIVKEPTEFDFGIVIYKCTVCNYKKTNQIDKLEHTHCYDGKWYKNNTHHWQECSCGDLSEKNSHNFVLDSILKEPTDTQNGLANYKCSECNYSINQVIDKLEHTHNFEGQWHNNQTHHWHECSCGITDVESVHKYEDNIIKEPTSNSEGCKESKCSVCGYTITTTIPKTSTSSSGCGGRISESLVGLTLLTLGIFVHKKKKES